MLLSRVRKVGKLTICAPHSSAESHHDNNKFSVTNTHIMGDRRKVSLNILGTKASFKLPKVKVFKWKCDNNEPEWSWQQISQSVSQHQSGSVLINNYGDCKHSNSRSLRHRFLSREQLDSIHTWLSQLEQPGDQDQEPLLEQSVMSESSTQCDLSVLSASSPSRHHHHHHHHHNSDNQSRSFIQKAPIHTEIF